VTLGGDLCAGEGDDHRERRDRSRDPGRFQAEAACDVLVGDRCDHRGGCAARDRRQRHRGRPRRGPGRGFGLERPVRELGGEDEPGRRERERTRVSAEVENADVLRSGEGERGRDEQGEPRGKAEREQQERAGPARRERAGKPVGRGRRVGRERGQGEQRPCRGGYASAGCPARRNDLTSSTATASGRSSSQSAIGIPERSSRLRTASRRSRQIR